MNDYRMPSWNEEVPNETTASGPLPLSPAPGSAPVLLGKWRHSYGMIFCGTLRIAKADFDTNPHPDFCARVFDYICRTMNEAQNS